MKDKTRAKLKQQRRRQDKADAQRLYEQFQSTRKERGLPPADVSPERLMKLYKNIDVKEDRKILMLGIIAEMLELHERRNYGMKRLLHFAAQCNEILQAIYNGERTADQLARELYDEMYYIDISIFAEKAIYDITKPPHLWEPLPQSPYLAEDVKAELELLQQRVDRAFIAPMYVLYSRYNYEFERLKNVGNKMACTLREMLTENTIPDCVADLAAKCGIKVDCEKGTFTACRKK